MFQFLLLPSLLVIAAALAARWYFGIRVWKECDDAARAAGLNMHNSARAYWRECDPKAAGARIGALRFGLATPPLSAIIGVFAIIVGKLPPSGAIALVMAITAIACAFGFLSLPAELSALQRYQKKNQRENRAYLAAQAEAWNLSLPPALRAIFK